MRLYTKIFIVILLLLIVMHYRKYESKADGYEIQQQELDYTNGSELYNQLNPLIITFIEETSLKDNVQNIMEYWFGTINIYVYMFGP